MRKIKYGALALILAVLLSGCAKKSETAKNDYPQSIVALSPASAEILFALGAGNQVSAVSDFTDYPAEATALPKVGGFDGKTLSMEKILSFKPDFVYLTDGMHNFLIEELESAKINYYVSNASSIKAVVREIQQIGEITGHSAEAKKVIAEMNQKISSFRRAFPDQRKMFGAEKYGTEGADELGHFRDLHVIFFNGTLFHVVKTHRNVLPYRERRRCQAARETY